MISLSQLQEEMARKTTRDAFEIHDIDATQNMMGMDATATVIRDNKNDRPLFDVKRLI